MKKYKLGLQLYTIKPIVAEDMDRALHEVKQMGYDCVEFAGYFGHTAEEIRAMLDKYGLECVSTHQHINIFEEEGKKAIEFQLKLGVKYSVIPACGPENYVDRHTWEAIRDRFKNVSKMLSKNGISLFYHNHDYEFDLMGDKTVYDTIFSEIGIENIKPEIDVCWAYYAGNDVVQLINRFSGNVPIMHIKDFSCVNLPDSYDYTKKEHKKKTKKENGFMYRPVGMGVIKLKEIVEAGKKAGTECFIVEQDSPGELSPLEAAGISAENLGKLL